MAYKRLLRPILFRWDPEAAHEAALRRFSRLRSDSIGFRLLSSRYTLRNPRLRQSLLATTFENPVGLAAGFDKSARAAPGLCALGFGHLEIGTLTPRPQPGNPKPRIFRIPEDEALVNRLGFNNDGLEAAARRLARSQVPVPVGVNLGKNRETPLADAHVDYATGVRTLFPYASYFAINVSSPNTPGLRQLQEREPLSRILGAVQEANVEEARSRGSAPRPILVKIAPDLTEEAISEAVAIARQHGVDGFIATNTTITRPHLRGAARELGGLSGRPLRALATRAVRLVRARAGPEATIIGVGGVFTAEDAFEKIAAGANLVQVYTGLIYEGPGVARSINRGLIRIMDERGAKSISELVGCEAR